MAGHQGMNEAARIVEMVTGGKKAARKEPNPKLDRLFPMQRKLMRALLLPQYDTHAWSMPRGNGKSYLASRVAHDILWPGTALHTPGTESILLSGSFDQARTLFKPVRTWLEWTGEYRFKDSAREIGALHKKSNTSLRVIGQNFRTAMGLVGVPWVIADEPGAWEVNAGQNMHSAIETAKGKMGSPLKSLYIGTRAPATAGWWIDLLENGTTEYTHVFDIRATPDANDSEWWQRWQEIRKANPVLVKTADGRRTLRKELAEAKRRTDKAAEFKSYRLNVPSADESELILTPDDWRLALARDVPPREGRPVVGVDLGGGRSWSAAVAVWRNGRVEALGVAPGIPSIQDQERRDVVPAGMYQKLVDAGTLAVAHGFRVPPVADFVAELLARWESPECLVCDRYRQQELKDHTTIKIVDRVPGYKQGSEDIRALRKMTKDGPLSIDPGSRALMSASLSCAKINMDPMGNVRMVKVGGANQKARDDVAFGLVLAAGEMQRRKAKRSMSELLKEVRKAQQ